MGIIGTRKKPRLVIIGEAHPTGLEAIFSIEGKLKLKIKEGNGSRRWVVDRSHGLEESKKSIQLINRMLQEEVRILKKEGIVKLFIEKDDYRGNREMYGRYKKTHDFKQLRAAFRREQEDRYTKAMEDAKVFLLALDMPPLLQRCCGLVLSPVESVFAQSSILVAHRAGIYDIVPFDEPESGWKLLMLHTADTLLNSCSIALIELMDQSANREEIKDAVAAANRFSVAINKQTSEYNGKREKKMSQSVKMEYVPGSAILCGQAHLDPLKKILSKEFSVQAYSVGEGLSGKEDRLIRGMVRDVLGYLKGSLFGKKGRAPKSK